MGATDGTITYVRYFATGDVPSKDDALEAIKRWAFEPLDKTTDEETAFGWVCVDNMLDTDFTRDRVIFNEYVNLTLRIDRWAFPPSIVRAEVKRLTKKRLAETGRQRLSKMGMDLIKETVLAEMKATATPKPWTADASWNTATGVLRFWSSNRRACELFEEVFEKTFGASLKRDSPYLGCLRAQLTDDLLAKLPDVEQCAFVDMQTL